MFSGSIVALITPMDPDGAVDYGSLKRLVDFHLSNQTDALVIMGTTGESVTLSFSEQIQVLEAVLAQVDGRIPVIAGNGSNSTADAVEKTKTLSALPIAGFLTVTPYYNKPTQKGLFAHYKAIAEAVSLPIIIYNIPGRSVIDMSPETMGALAKAHKNIVGVKDATGKIERVSEQRITCGADFVQLSGEDATALGFNAHGGVGCISVTANVAPRLCADFQAATRTGDFVKALELQDRA